MNEYETRRLENIKRNEALIRDLGIQRLKSEKPSSDAPRPVKKRKIVVEARPSRTSSRIASKPTPIKSYNEDEILRSQAVKAVRDAKPGGRKSGRLGIKSAMSYTEEEEEEEERETSPSADIDELQQSWSDWKPEEGAPVRDENKVFHFESHPTFTPNKSPQEMLQEGCFGGSYFRPLYSKSLGITIFDDWRELPSDWASGLNIERYLISPTYDPDVNKYKVKCGQSIEEWEAAGWINHQYDVRGWFQWYCRYFMGRRCDDDDRQIGRWSRAAGENGRFRLALLRKYIKLGVKDVFDDGEEGEDAAEVSPVVHQTCHHWAFEVRQDVLDAFWRKPR